MTIATGILNELIATACADGIEKFVVGAFILKDKKFLIVKRAASEDFLPNLHEIPSGGVEAGESLLQALEREVFEETGLKILDVTAYVNYFDYLSGSGKKTREFNFLVKTDGFNVHLNPVEHSEYCWVDVASEDYQTLNLSTETRVCINDAYGKHVER